MHPATATRHAGNRHLPRILHLASGDLWAGAEAQVFTLAYTLVHDLGVTTRVVLLNHGELEHRLQGNGIQTLVLDETRLGFPEILRQFTSILAAGDIDVIHTHRFKENIIGSLAGWLAGRIPSVRTVHGMPEQPPSRRQIARRIIRLADRLSGRFLQQRVIAVSDDMTKHLQRIYPADSIVTIPNGVLVPPPEDATGTIRRQDPVASITRNIGIAGRLVPVKRIDIFIRAASSFITAHPGIDCTFHVFGDGPLRAALEQLAGELIPAGRIKFAGHVTDIRSALTGLDALMLTSDHEGLPMILLEAMAAGTPVIAHATGGIPEVLDQGRCGILVWSETAEDFAEALYRLLGDGVLADRLVTLARQRVSERYSALHNAITTLELYQAVALENAPAKRRTT